METAGIRSRRDEGRKKVKHQKLKPSYTLNLASISRSTLLKFLIDTNKHRQLFSINSATILPTLFLHNL